jgi:DNA-binding NarL/FixJ family response regulator
MKILIADDHAIVRHGLKDLLAERFSDAAFGEAETAQETLEKIWNDSWDAVLLDVAMPGASGVEILPAIKRARPNLPVLVLSMHPEEQYAMRVFQAGAAGYVSKSQAPHQLIDALEKVLSGGKYVSVEVAEKLVNQLKPGGQRLPHERLSNRELQILRLVASGHSMKSIAKELSVTNQTVSTHRARMLKKMNLQSTAALIRYALEHGLVD